MEFFLYLIVIFLKPCIFQSPFSIRS